jgi:hypothetical protein
MSEVDLNLEGENLYRQFMGAIAGQNWSAVEAMISPSFQSVHTDGARDQAGEIDPVSYTHLRAHETG